MKYTISTKRAAALMGTSVDTIREMIAHGSPIGIMLDGKERRTFKVFAPKIAELTGIPLEEVQNEA